MSYVYGQYATFVNGVTSLPSRNNWAFSNRIEDLNMQDFDIARFATGAVGMVAEVTEMIEARVEGKGNESRSKELGDLAWYITNAAIALGGDMGDYMPNENIEIGCSTEELDTLLVIKTGRFLDEVKKVLWHGKPWNDELKETFEERLTEITDLWVCAANALGGTAAVIDQNVAKLSSRYPGGTFSIDRSENRAEGDD